MNSQLPIVQDPVVNRYLEHPRRFAGARDVARRSRLAFLHGEHERLQRVRASRRLHLREPWRGRTIGPVGPVCVGDRTRNRARGASALGQADPADAGREHGRDDRVRAHQHLQHGRGTSGNPGGRRGNLRQVQPRGRSTGGRRRHPGAWCGPESIRTECRRCSRSCSPSASPNRLASTRGSPTTRWKKIAFRRSRDQIAEIHPAIIRELTSNTRGVPRFQGAGENTAGAAGDRAATRPLESRDDPRQRGRGTPPPRGRWSPSTSAWLIGALESPDARFVMQLTPTTRMPIARATITSGTVDMPTASAPSAASIRTSAGVSYVGPRSPAYTPSRSVDALLRGRRPRQLGELGIVRSRHVGKANGRPRSTRADQRVAEHQIDVIPDQHQIARVPQAVHAARGVRDDQRRRAERVDDAHGERGQPDVVPFVHVEAPGEREHSPPAKRARDQRPRVPGDGRAGKPGISPYGTTDAVSISSASPPSPEPSTIAATGGDSAPCRPSARTNRVGGAPRRAGAERRASVTRPRCRGAPQCPRGLGDERSRSSHGRNALSNPLQRDRAQFVERETECRWRRDDTRP